PRRRSPSLQAVRPGSSRSPGGLPERTEALVERFAEQLRVVRRAREDGGLGVELLDEDVAHRAERTSCTFARLTRRRVPRTADDQLRKIRLRKLVERNRRLPGRPFDPGRLCGGKRFHLQSLVPAGEAEGAKNTRPVVLGIRRAVRALR